MKKRLACDWFLSDGILPPVRLEAPGPVREALFSAGVLEAETGFMSEMKNEWIYRRSWRYLGAFDAPGDGRRVILTVDGLAGKWAIQVNGQTAAEGDAAVSDAEITDLVKEGRNEIAVSFSPPDPGEPRPEIGFSGACQLRYADSVVIKSFQMTTAPDGAWTAHVTTDSTEAAACDFRFTLSGKTVSVERTIHEMLSPGEETRVMTPFDAEATGLGERAKVTVTVLINEKASDESEYLEFIPNTGTAAHGFRVTNGFSVSQTRRAGGNAVCAPDSASVRVMAADHDLMFLPYMSLIGRRALAATPDADALYALLDGDFAAFHADAAWYFTSGDREGLNETREKIGEEVNDLKELTRLTRYIQAIDLRARAEYARIQRETFLVDDAFDSYPRLASRAVFDGDVPRPAFFALLDAWKKDHAFVRPPESFPGDGIVNIPVFYVSDDRKLPVTVNATAYGTDGQEAVSASFPVTARTPDLVGRVCAEIPEDGCLILRTRVILKDVTLSTSDAVITKDLKNLLSLDRTQLLINGDTVQNVGSAAAIGVAVSGADYFGALLPGESVRMIHPTDRRVEGLNIDL